MKTGCCLFTIICFGVFTLGVSVADEPSGQPSGQGPEENQTTSDSLADHIDGKRKGVNEGQADTMHPKSSDTSRAAEKSSQTGPKKGGTLPANRPVRDHPKAGKGPEENQTTSERPADHMDGKQQGVNEEQADIMRPKLTHRSGAAQKGSLTGSRKKGILPADRSGHPEQVPNSHAVADEKRVGKLQSKLPLVNHLHQPGLSKPSNAVAKDGIKTRARDPREEPTRKLPAGGGADPPLPGVVRSRRAATPIIGQLMPSRAKTSTAVINGSGMKRKP